MEVKYYFPLFLGAFLLLFWTLDYFKVFFKTKLYLPKVTKKQKISFRFLNYCLGFLALSLIIFSSTLPRKQLKIIPGTIEVNDIFLVVDVSRSMLAEDMKPNRLEVAKSKLSEFAGMRPTDRIGVILFSEKIFTLLPLTTDSHLINEVINDINVGYLGSGTNIGDGLAVAVARLHETETKHKIVILLTDGVNNVGNMTPIESAKIAKEFGVKVYTITLATDKEAKLPIGKGFFGTQYQVIPGGSYDLKTMQEVSDLTGAKSYMAQDQNALKEILSEIQALEKTKIKTNSQVVYDELYFIYLLWGVILFVIHEVIRKIIFKEAF